MTHPSKRPVHRPRLPLEPWQSWGTTVRYLVICLGMALPGVLIVWLVSGRH